MNYTAKEIHLFLNNVLSMKVKDKTLHFQMKMYKCIKLDNIIDHDLKISRNDQKFDNSLIKFSYLSNLVINKDKI